MAGAIKKRPEQLVQDAPGSPPPELPNTLDHRIKPSTCKCHVRNFGEAESNREIDLRSNRAVIPDLQNRSGTI